MATILRYSGICRPVARGEFVNLVADDADRFLLVIGKFLPAELGEARNALQPIQVQLVALVFLQEFRARNFVGLGQAHEPAFQRIQPLVDVIELLNQRLDTRIVQRQRFHFGDDIIAQLAVAPLLARRKLGRLRHFLVLQLAQRFILLGNAVENFQNLGLELRFHGRERYAEVIALIVILILDNRLVEILRRKHVAIFIVALGGLCLLQTLWPL